MDVNKLLGTFWPKLTNGRENPIQKRKSSFENKDSIQYFNKNIHDLMRFL